MNVLDKIAKLMRLAKSSNPHEAAAALRQAQALMQRHNLSELDVQLAEIRQERATAAGKHHAAWLIRLVHLVADAFGLQSYGDQGEYVFVGRETRAAVGAYTFIVLRRQCQKARAEFYRKARGKRANRIRRADLFALGWVYAVRRKVEDFAMPPQERELIAQYLQTQGVQLTTFAPRKTRCGGGRDGDAIFAGFKAAANVQLHHGVSGSGPLALEHQQ